MVRKVIIAVLFRGLHGMYTSSISDWHFAAFEIPLLLIFMGEWQVEMAYTIEI